MYIIIITQQRSLSYKLKTAHTYVFKQEKKEQIYIEHKNKEKII